MWISHWRLQREMWNIDKERTRQIELLWEEVRNLRQLLGESGRGVMRQRSTSSMLRPVSALSLPDIPTVKSGIFKHYLVNNRDPLNTPSCTISDAIKKPHPPSDQVCVPAQSRGKLPHSPSQLAKTAVATDSQDSTQKGQSGIKGQEEVKIESSMTEGVSGSGRRLSSCIADLPDGVREEAQRKANTYRAMVKERLAMKVAEERRAKRQKREGNKDDKGDDKDTEASRSTAAAPQSRASATERPDFKEVKSTAALEDRSSGPRPPPVAPPEALHVSDSGEDAPSSDHSSCVEDLCPVPRTLPREADFTLPAHQSGPTTTLICAPTGKVLKLKAAPSCQEKKGPWRPSRTESGSEFEKWRETQICMAMERRGVYSDSGSEDSQSSEERRRSRRERVGREQLRCDRESPDKKVVMDKMRWKFAAGNCNIKGSEYIRNVRGNFANDQMAGMTYEQRVKALKIEPKKKEQLLKKREKDRQKASKEERARVKETRMLEKKLDEEERKMKAKMVKKRFDQQMKTEKVELKIRLQEEKAKHAEEKRKEKEQLKLEEMERKAQEKEERKREKTLEADLKAQEKEKRKRAEEEKKREKKQQKHREQEMKKEEKQQKEMEKKQKREDKAWKEEKNRIDLQRKNRPDNWLWPFRTVMDPKPETKVKVETRGKAQSVAYEVRSSEASEESDVRERQTESQSRPQLENKRPKEKRREEEDQ